jgi:hypothetical protein
MSLYKRGKVYWSAIWVDGVRQMRSLETANRRKAETLEQLPGRIAHQKFQLPQFKPEMPFGELYARFLADGEVKPYHLDRAKLFLPFFYRDGNRPDHPERDHSLPQTPPQEYLFKQKEAETPNRSLKPPSTGTSKSSAICSSGQPTKASFPHNPIARIRMVRERRQRRPVMPVAEEAKLLRSCSDHLWPIVIAALDTGMRRGELFTSSGRTCRLRPQGSSSSPTRRPPRASTGSIPAHRSGLRMLSAAPPTVGASLHLRRAASAPEPQDRLGGGAPPRGHSALPFPRSAPHLQLATGRSRRDRRRAQGTHGPQPWGRCAFALHPRRAAHAAGRDRAPRSLALGQTQLFDNRSTQGETSDAGPTPAPPPETDRRHPGGLLRKARGDNRDLIQAHLPTSQSRSTPGTITPVSSCFWTSRTGSRRCSNILKVFEEVLRRLNPNPIN